MAEMLENVLLTQEVKDLKREYQFFPTPRAVAERMCEMAEIDSASEVLEPSCGNGQLADVIWEHLPAGMCCIELNTDMKRYLAEKPYGVNYRDFLDVAKKEIGGINRVVMNPPFTRHQDIDHVRHAYKTITAKHTGGIVAPSLIQYHTEQTENVRASGLGAPIPTVDASNRYGLTCANLVKYYLFGVPEERDLKKDDLVLVRNSRGEVPAVCVCDSFSVPENVLEQLQKMYGGKTLKWVIGSVEFLRWEQEKEEAK